ncbi:hypothetical protein IPZ61_12655 [Streptomyces sioyaensis]|uniref:hypothetical protein n=1 Tax=Streptomyces sioyaensis TaxID=67364 RepID=UPI001F48B7E6|nr:hypothetical protein [Streptomyces sioyaensis]MCF3174162.1 hypothetical protein [Streptomyces sioyaensis]
MMSNAKIGVALVGGYVLGRTKKAKLAIGLGMYLAGKRLPLDPKQLGKLVANSPVLGPLNDQVRSELVDATKSAVSTALTQRMSALTDSLHERTLELNDAESESRTGGDTETADEPADEERVNSGTTKTAAKTAAKTAKPAGGTKAAKSTKSAKSATGKAAQGTGKTASGARKTATGARKKASGTARRTADRGGRND